MDTANISDIHFAILRYFNVSGADPLGRSGQLGENSTHLIRVSTEVALGKRAGMSVYGTDYKTPDGTCIRDFIHVSDLADAYILALEYLSSNCKKHNTELWLWSEDIPFGRFLILWKNWWEKRLTLKMMRGGVETLGS